MIWTREDEMALASCFRVKRTAAKYCTRPVPVYRTLLKMYAAMEEAGLIERELIEPTDACAECVNHRNGTCRKEYQQAEMGFKDEKIVSCGLFRKKKDPFPMPPEIRFQQNNCGDLCHGCENDVNGCCRIGYQGAELSEDRSAVVKCERRRESR